MLELRIGIPRDQLDHAPLKVALVKVGFGLAHLYGDLRGIIAASFADCEQQPQEMIAKVAGDVRNHSQVDQGHLVVFRQKDISRMWIRMEKPVDENLFEIRAEDLFGESLSVELHQPQRTDIGNFLPFDVVHGQDARGRVVIDGLRNHDLLEFNQRAPQSLQVAGFTFEIEFM